MKTNLRNQQIFHLNMQPRLYNKTNLGGLNLSRRGLDRDSWSRQRPKVSLEDQDISILSRHQRPDQRISIEIEKFVEIWKFLHFSTVCLDLDREVRGFLYFLVKISQSVETFHHFQTQKALTMSRFLDKSWQRLDKSRLHLDKSWKSRRVSTNLDNLDASRQSWQKSRRVKVSTEKSRF
jgi:hypothetical protein